MKNYFVRDQIPVEIKIKNAMKFHRNDIFMFAKCSHRIFAEPYFIPNGT